VTITLMSNALETGVPGINDPVAVREAVEP
jgi:hypothetical protein